MQSVVETDPYLAAAKAIGLSPDEQVEIVDYLAANPTAGNVIAGAGGCRKLRFGLGNRGKRAGVRIITFFTGPRLPIFLITVFAKNEKLDLTKAEASALAIDTKVLVETYERRNRDWSRP